MNVKSYPLQLLKALDDMFQAFDCGQELEAISYDLRKAFDTIHHHKRFIK